ncbi:ribosome biogenesis GTPase Der [Candidatus Parcubacteria bacterium]|jgi:GTP-binding protein|nr:MAG: ribosome biogenesis GTPase Der [Candidatus Parcubacteria bacterium]
MAYPAVLILGRTNVGKSTLFNRLSGGRFAITHASAHTTRDLQKQPVSWNNKLFTLIDSGGFDLRPDTDLSAAVLKQIENASQAAEVVVLVIDGGFGWSQAENQLFKKLAKAQKKIIIAVNKMDSPAARNQSELTQRLKRGPDKPIFVSAKNGGGTGDLLDAITAKLEANYPPAKAATTCKVAIVGKTNVGKSALTNALLGEEVRVVSGLPHTTRDVAEYEIIFQKQAIILIDTAGVRTRGRTADQIEALSLKATLNALAEADIAMLVWSANEKIGLVEKTLAGYAAKNQKGLLLVANQVDKLPSRDSRELKHLEKIYRCSLAYVNWAPLLFASALKKTGLEKILDVLLQIRLENSKRLTLEQLNQIRKEIIRSLNFKTSWQKKISARLEQTPSPSPNFELKVDGRHALPEAIIKIAEKKLREKHGFVGVPLGLKLLQPFAKKI